MDGRSMMIHRVKIATASRRIAQTLGVTLTLGIALAAGAARADALQSHAPDAGRPAVSLSEARTVLALPYAQANALEAAAVAPKRSVDRAIASNALVGSLGFLCGLQPRAYDNSASDPYGYDPHGRFVGAKLSLAFK